MKIFVVASSPAAARAAEAIIDAATQQAEAIRLEQLRLKFLGDATGDPFALNVPDVPDLTLEVAQAIVDEDGLPYRLVRVLGTRASAVAWYELGPLGERSIVISHGRVMGFQG